MKLCEYLYRAFWRKMLDIGRCKTRVKALRKLGYKVGQQVYLGPGLTIAGGIMDKVDGLEIDDRVSFGPHVTLLIGSHPNESRLNRLFNKSWQGNVIRIGEDSWLGANVVVMPNITIGKCCVIGAGAVVTHDVQDYTIMAGVPAKQIGVVDREKLEEVNS